MVQGPHIVKKLRMGRPVRWYVYAWRGGPCVHKQVGGVRPSLTGEIIDAIASARSKGEGGIADGTVSSLIVGYRSSPEWKRLAQTTQRGWSPWLDQIDGKFGRAPLAAFDDRRVRNDILTWRDGYADRPRSADMAMQVLSRLLSWGVDRGRLAKNHAAGIDQLYESNRADIVWTEADFAAFKLHACDEVREGVELAACTGLRRGDLVSVPWCAVGEHAIIWQTGKSRGRARIVIPLLPETRVVLDGIKARHALEMAARPEGKRKPLPETILSNSMWRAWTPMGFSSRFHDAKKESGVKVNLHDLRGTFATRCMIAGLTDQEIADILGWNTKDVAIIRLKYVDQARVVVAMAERISRGTK